MAMQIGIKPDKWKSTWQPGKTGTLFIETQMDWLQQSAAWQPGTDRLIQYNYPALRVTVAE